MAAKPPSESRATLVRWMGIEDANHPAWCTAAS